MAKLTQSKPIASQTRAYGVRDRLQADDDVARAIESLRCVGHAVVSAGYSDEELDDFASRFDKALSHSQSAHGGSQRLASLDEHRTIRALCTVDEAFLGLARNKKIVALTEALIGGYVVLNQQNGIINPPNGDTYNQAAWHRDLPYQHFVSSRPLALNALFCVDPFTIENGSTQVLPATHKQEAFPSEDYVASHAQSVTAPRGSFIVLDAMLFHQGGVNTTSARRRAINHLYTIPLIRQQIDLPAIFGDRYALDHTLGPFLGYTVRTPSSVEAYYQERESRVRAQAPKS